MGNLLAIRGAQLASLCEDLNIPWAAETALIRPDHPNMLKLKEWQKHLDRATTSRVDLAQCSFADSPIRPPHRTYTKSTTIVGNVALGGLTGLRCKHALTSWMWSSTGRKFLARHPPLIGRESPLMWTKGIGGPDDEGGWAAPPGAPDDYLTRATAAYPAELTWQIFGILVIESCQRIVAELRPSPRQPSSIPHPAHFMQQATPLQSGYVFVPPPPPQAEP